MEAGVVAEALTALGCPPAQSLAMAEQLLKRAGQLATARAITEEAALEHLLRLMAGGWAAQERGFGTLPPVSRPEAPTEEAQRGDEDLPAESARPTATSVPAWPLLSSQELADYRIFRVRSDRKRHPRTGTEHDLYAIDCSDWVNVVAITKDDQVVLVEQYRHGTNTVELEAPGGIMDPGETDPVAAGVRELREETGYGGDAAHLLATVFPNPAIQSNRCHVVLVTGCERRHELEWDPAEELATRLAPAAAIPELILTGAVRHALVVAALSHYWFRRQAGA